MACYSHIECAALTSQGLKRKNNEDAFGVYREHGVFCIADGMGGAADGEVASKAAVDHVSQTLGRFDPTSPLTLSAMRAWLCRALDEASDWILAEATRAGKRGTGTTFVGVCFDPERPGAALALHAGDSRLYLIHKRCLTQITQDHSLAVAAGVRDENDLDPALRGMILRAVGLTKTMDVECTAFDVVAGDHVLLCSDGLTKMVKDKAIMEIVRSADTTDTAARHLVAAANDAGGKDNITVIVVKVPS